MVLPGWPVHILLFGFPVFWALGLLPFVYVIAAVPMLILLALRRGTVLLPGMLPWFAFLAWSFASSVMIADAGGAIGYLQRVGDLVGLGVIMTYYVNARERLGRRLVIPGVLVIWATTVLLGIAAVNFPDFRLNTPVGMALPDELTRNPLVNELVFPRLAEVQHPWGAAAPYNRPAAPFPYANSWGVAYVLLTPVAIAFILGARRWWAKLLVILLLAASVWPAIQTSNRGMFLGLGVVLAYVIWRLAMQGRVGPAVLALLMAGGAAWALFASGSVAAILGRQQFSDSTGTRANVYAATFHATAESPLLGWANPQNDVTIGIALGTQGYVWTLMYCFGFVGLGLFLVFLLGAVARTAGVRRPADLWLHGSLVAGSVIIVFYGLGSTQLLVVCLLIAVLLRERYLDEAAR